jgi:hypothetical protein
MNLISHPRLLALVFAVMTTAATAQVVDDRLSRGTGFDKADEIILHNRSPYMVQCIINWSLKDSSFGNRSIVQAIGEYAALRSGTGGTVLSYKFSCDKHPSVAAKEREELARQRREQAERERQEAARQEQLRLQDQERQRLQAEASRRDSLARQRDDQERARQGEVVRDTEAARQLEVDRARSMQDLQREREAIQRETAKMAQERARGEREQRLRYEEARQAQRVAAANSLISMIGAIAEHASSAERQGQQVPLTAATQQSARAEALSGASIQAPMALGGAAPSELVASLPQRREGFGDATNVFKAVEGRKPLSDLAIYNESNAPKRGWGSFFEFLATAAVSPIDALAPVPHPASNASGAAAGIEVGKVSAETWTEADVGKWQVCEAQAMRVEPCRVSYIKASASAQDANASLREGRLSASAAAHAIADTSIAAMKVCRAVVDDPCKVAFDALSRTMTQLKSLATQSEKP